MEEYKKIFIEFSDKTNEILEALNNEDYDKVNAALSQREQIIDSMKAQNIDREVFKEMDKLLKIQEKEAQIKALLSKKAYDVKDEIRKLQLTGKANHSYNKGFYDKNKIFSKKV